MAGTYPAVYVKGVHDVRSRSGFCGGVCSVLIHLHGAVWDHRVGHAIVSQTEEVIMDRKYIQVTEGQKDQHPIMRSIEVCAECEEQAPMRGNNPDRVCKDCYDGQLGHWIVANTSV